MKNYFPKRPSGAPLHTLSKLYNVPVGFVTPHYFEAEYCLFCGRQRLAVARYRMICLVLGILKATGMILNKTLEYSRGLGILIVRCEKKNNERVDSARVKKPLCIYICSADDLSVSRIFV